MPLPLAGGSGTMTCTRPLGVNGLPPANFIVPGRHAGRDSAGLAAAISHALSVNTWRGPMMGEEGERVVRVAPVEDSEQGNHALAREIGQGIADMLRVVFFNHLDGSVVLGGYQAHWLASPQTADDASILQAIRLQPCVLAGTLDDGAPMRRHLVGIGATRRSRTQCLLVPFSLSPATTRSSQCISSGSSPRLPLMAGFRISMRSAPTGTGTCDAFRDGSRPFRLPGTMMRGAVPEMTSATVRRAACENRAPVAASTATS